MQVEASHNLPKVITQCRRSRAGTGTQAQASVPRFLSWRCPSPHAPVLPGCPLLDHLHSLPLCCLLQEQYVPTQVGLAAAARDPWGLGRAWGRGWKQSLAAARPAAAPTSSSLHAPCGPPRPGAVPGRTEELRFRTHRLCAALLPRTHKSGHPLRETDGGGSPTLRVRRVSKSP